MMGLAPECNQWRGRSAARLFAGRLDLRLPRRKLGAMRPSAISARSRVDLAQMIINAAERAGFKTIDEKTGQFIPGGAGGLPPGFLPVASTCACRAASLARCSAISC
jgi:hypothetical protein